MASHRDQHLKQSYLVGSHYVYDWVYLQGSVCSSLRQRCVANSVLAAIDTLHSNCLFAKRRWASCVMMWAQLCRLECENGRETLCARIYYVFLRNRYLPRMRNICLATSASKWPSCLHACMQQTLIEQMQARRRTLASRRSRGNRGMPP